MSENKTGKYFKYAIGEIILVVIGILIALSINNWNEQRKSNVEKNELIFALNSDFESTQKILADIVTNSDSLILKNIQLLNILSLKHITVSRKHINDLTSSFFIGTSFSPNLSAYKAAKSNGKLKLIGSNRLLELFTELDGQFENFNQHRELSGQNFYTGSLSNLRNKVGSFDALLRVVRDIDRYNYSDSELMEILTQKESYASLETTFTLNRNINNILHDIQEIINEILIELNTLK